MEWSGPGWTEEFQLLAASQGLRGSKGRLTSAPQGREKKCLKLTMTNRITCPRNDMPPSMK